ncbi:MAG: hypothetical protein JXR84_14650 [Anaerolineae bacterium]|nr:hypothetical protein [Anaerolineae bacterium]
MSSSGYVLIEQREPTPTILRDDLRSPRLQRGLLDFLRDLAEDELPYPKWSLVTVTGLDEVLYAAQPDEEALAHEIHGRLNQAASRLESRLILIEMRLKGQIIRGDPFRLRHRGIDLPLHIIFDTPGKAADGNYYLVRCHLS